MHAYREKWNEGMVMNGQYVGALQHEVTPEMRQKMERSAKNKLWAMDNASRLRLEYPDKYVALDDGVVLASGDSPDEVFRELRRVKIKDISAVAIEFVQGACSFSTSGRSSSLA
jgi:hypothetical protein